MSEKYEQKPTLAEVTFGFYQDGNTLGTTEEYEKLEVTVESQVGDVTDGPFFVIRTKGWSVDGVFELDDLFKRIKNSIEKAG